ncbi:MAG: VWA domain-containing protein, partial [Rhodoblastus sp.]|nr:VWA domain-containing protein [Rhodoblastus sp.]
MRIVEQTSLTMGKYEEFVRDQAGGVALIFAASAPVAALIVFGSLDYSRMVGARARLQSATDSAALALAMNATSSTTQAMIAAQAASAIAAAAGSGSPSVVSVSLSNNNTQVCLTTSQSVLSIATRIVGIGSTTVQATSCATTNSSIGGAFEIALALDNTGSMASSAGGRSKLDSAKTAALSLVDQLSSSGANARFSVV